MADSDDEYGRYRMDKFHPERGDYDPVRVREDLRGDHDPVRVREDLRGDHDPVRLREDLRGDHDPSRVREDLRGDHNPSRVREDRRGDHRKDRVRERSREQDRKERRRHEKGQRHREKGHRRHDRGHGQHDRGHGQHERGHSHYEKSEQFTPSAQDLGCFQPLPERVRRDWHDAGREHCYGGGDFRSMVGGRGVNYPPPHPWVYPEAPPMQQNHATFIPPRFGGGPDAPPGCPPAALKGFKEFLLGLDPAVGEVEAVRCYSEYKVTFRRQQIEAFFLAHREEEWFRLRYHPDTERRDAETHNALQKRLGVFMYLLGKGWFDNVTLDITQAPAIIKVLDAVQIRFEGGTENDLRVLEMPTKKQGEKEERRKGEEEERRKEERRKGEEERRKGEEEERRKKEERRKEERLLSGEIQSEAQKQDEGQAVDPENILTPGAEKLARKRKHIEGEDISESAAAASVLHPFDQSAEWETGGKKRTEDTSNRDEEDKKEMKRYIEEEEEEDEGEKAEDGKSEEGEDGEVGKGGQTENKIDEEREDDRGDEREEERGDERGDDGGEERGEGDKEARREAPPLPRQLHKTRSLFMRGIPPSICKKEIVNLFVKYPGFMRVCLSEPHADHRFFRRCWVTFDYLANIQDICLQLQNARWHDYKLSPVVHRELCRRVRAANGITQHRTLLQDHIRLAAKLIRTLDRRWTLWGEDQDQGNPVLRNVSQHLVEEVSAEEEELTGNVGGVIPQSEVAVETDNKLVKVLDCLLLYLRIVHSVDFYSACQHSGEHDMPSCCGTVHVRGPTPASRVPVEQVLDWQKRFEDKLIHLFFPRERLGDEEAENMGLRHSQQEVEKFVTANTRELDKEKWLCVLCGKRFKGPEFVRKHLLARHGEEVEEVRKEALFFNNFLMDPKRPYFPGMRSPPPRPPRPGQEGGGPGPPFSPRCLWGFGQTSPPLVGYEGSPFPPDEYGADGGHLGWSRGGPAGKPQRNRSMRGQPGKVIRYHDWDAPGEDFF